MAVRARLVAVQANVELEDPSGAAHQGRAAAVLRQRGEMVARVRVRGGREEVLSKLTAFGGRRAERRRQR